MKRIYIFRLIVAVGFTSLLTPGCYKYQMNFNYASIKGSVVDSATGSASPYASWLTVSMLPSNVTNGSLVLDSTGSFINTRILPGAYTLYANANDPYLYAFDFSTDTMNNVNFTAGGTTDVNLKVSLRPWVTVTSAITGATSTTITVSYTVKSNKAFLANECAIDWDTVPGNVDIKTEPLDGGDYNSHLNWNNFTEPNPPNTSPATSIDGTYSYTITGLSPNTAYYIGVMARVPDNDALTDPKGNPSGSKGDWWNDSKILSAKTSQ